VFVYEAINSRGIKKADCFAVRGQIAALSEVRRTTLATSRSQRHKSDF